MEIVQHPFDKEGIVENSRLNSIKKLLKDKKLTHILISDLIDIEYLSGFRSSNALILISKKKNLIFSDFRYKEVAELFCLKNPEWCFNLVKESLYSSLCPFFNEGSICGIQANDLSVSNYDQLVKANKNVNFVKFHSEISDIFMQKSAQEISSIKKAAKIGDTAFELLLNEIESGLTEKQLAAKLESLCRELGSEKPSFETIVLFGSRSALPHGKPCNKKLKKGDFILIDFGCTVNGLCSDMTRTLIFGKANSMQQKIYQIVLEAQKKACNAVKIGMSSKELDQIARNHINSLGYGNEFGHALGHGVGLRIHEPPRISSSAIETTLQENMVITIEPGIYVPDFGGVRIEDMAVLGKKKTAIITSAPKELIQL